MSIKDLIEQKAQLEVQIEELRQVEKEEVVARINIEIEHYNISAADLKFPGTAVVASKAKDKPASSVAPKYRHPDTGATWTGRGKPPAWIKDVESREAYKIAA